MSVYIVTDEHGIRLRIPHPYDERAVATHLLGIGPELARSLTVVEVLETIRHDPARFFWLGDDRGPLETIRDAYNETKGPKR